MRRIVLAALAVAGVVGYRRWRQADDDRRVWREATDTLQES